MERVLSPPELLENILLHLDMTTLLVSVQRVSKAWNNTIACSTALQQKLFFRSITAEQLPAFREQLMGEAEMTGSDYEYLGPELTKLVLNPLLVKKFGFCFFDTGPGFGYSRGLTVSTCCHGVQIVAN
uniref:F-box domain-containing protein n=1 Tax=Photinus pyralis TaxID=7054 RepID=A0A1Y1NBE9_PHOPY